MRKSFTVHVVDDDPYILEVVRGILEADYTVETFPSAEPCWQQMSRHRPDMVLLDIRMPEMNGYDFCRMIKDDENLKSVPVIFISSQESIEDRLLGYDSGGEDFIVKPFQPEELRRKVRVAEQIVNNQRRLKEQTEDAELLSSLVMANIDEYAILLNYIRQLIAWESEQDIASGLLELLRRYKLQGVAQTRIAGRCLTLSASGSNIPLEASILDHLREQGRIFEFHNRSVHNFERITLMISNMPLDDPDFCGRLRDHLSIAAECTESRLRSLETEEADRRSQSGIGGAVDQLRMLVSAVRDSHLRDRTLSADLLMRLEQDIARAFAGLGMSDEQENFLDTLIRNFVKELLELFDSDDVTVQALEDLSAKLGLLRRNH